MSGRVLLVLLVVVCRTAVCIEDECSRNTYNTSGTFMQFTKEPTANEFAIIDTFKGLHCCAKGYRSVEWIKDGISYPWSSSVSGLILYPESANQTIYTQSITKEDAGIYTCVLRNDSSVYEHTIQLKIYDKIPDDPMLTYLSEDKEVSVGHSVRLFCEAFVGIVNLPDAHSEVIWGRPNDNGSLDDEPRIRQEKVSREKGNTFGTYLTIEDVQEQDFGKYICTITKPGRTREWPVYLREKVQVEYLDPNPFPVKKVALWGTCILLIVLTLAVLNMKFGLPLRVKFKDRFGNIEFNDGKSNDILIVHARQDLQFVCDVLLPSLEIQYRCSTRELPSNVSMWCAHTSMTSKESRRILAVISPRALNNRWDCSSLYEALKQLNTLDCHLTCIVTEDMPRPANELKNSDGETCTSLARTMSILKYDDSQRFWLMLRLRLPARRLTDSSTNLDTTAVQSKARLSVDSQDSLDVFV